MQMPKASDTDKRRFRELVEPFSSEVRAIEVKPMFGQLGAFVNGNMFAGLYGDVVGVKLNETDLSELDAAGGGPFPPDRPMREYRTIPDSVAVEDWLARSVGFVSTLPPKPVKGAKGQPPLDDPLGA